VRSFPESGARHKYNDELLPGNLSLPRCLFDERLTIPTNSENSLVAHDDQLPKMLWVLLHFGSMLRPSEVVSHALFEFTHFAQLHNA
jgi:hypothetical protein